jgi:hypothetical protein
MGCRAAYKVSYYNRIPRGGCGEGDRLIYAFFEEISFSVNLTCRSLGNSALRYAVYSFMRTAVPVILVVAVLGCLSAQHQTRSGIPKVIVRVARVEESPGFWTGILAATQWMDAIVTKSAVKGFSQGQTLHFGVYVQKGHPLSDTGVPRLDPTKVHSGAMLAVRGGPGCFSSDRIKDLVVDPNCVKPTK